MPGATSPHNVPYPLETDLVQDGAADIQRLAEQIDDRVLTSLTTGSLGAESISTANGLTSAPGAAGQVAVSSDGNVYFGADYGIYVGRDGLGIKTNGSLRTLGGTVHFGGDCSIAREASGVLSTPGAFAVAGMLWSRDDTGNAYMGLGFGGAQDVLLHRVAAGTLQTNARFNCTGLGVAFGALGARSIEVGGPDSGGAGYRMVRVTN